MTTDVEIVPFQSIDEPRITAFFDALGDIDRTFIHAAVLRPGVIASWIEDAAESTDRRFLTVTDDEVVGYLAVVPDTDWSAHVASVRIVVHPAHRRQGIATAMARHAVLVSAREGIKKLLVEVLSHEAATIAMFTGLGFEAEALFHDQVRGPGGESYDLLVLSHFVDELYETMTAAGVDGAITA